MENSMMVLGEQAQQEIQPITAKAEMIAEAIQNEQGYATAAMYLLQIKAARKRIAALLDPFVDSAHQAWKQAIGERKKYDAPLDEAERIVKPAMVAYDSARESARFAQQRELEAQARKREEDRMLAEAEQAGNGSEADAILSRPIETAPIVLPTSPRISGISMREVWSFEVSDIKALARAVAEGKVPTDVIQPNDRFLGQAARALKRELKYPGVRVYSTKTIAAGGR